MYASTQSKPATPMMLNGEIIAGCKRRMLAQTVRSDQLSPQICKDVSLHVFKYKCGARGDSYRVCRAGMGVLQALHATTLTCESRIRYPASVL